MNRHFGDSQNQNDSANIPSDQFLLNIVMSATKKENLCQYSYTMYNDVCRYVAKNIEEWKFNKNSYLQHRTCRKGIFQ